MSAPVEVTTRYATSVEDLAAAWSFVMQKIDAVGPNPHITITPRWIVSVHEVVDGREDEDPPREFEVVVSGMVHEGD